MAGKAGSTVGSVIFFVLAPGAVAGLVPYMISKWRFEPSFLGVLAVRFAGGMLVVMGVVSLVHCFVRFALEGRGTPAPVAPTEALVVSGLYRYVRNPMYLAVVGMIAGQAFLFGSVSLIGYATVVWMSFNAFVLWYEEPTLRRRYGNAYEAYRANVPRWVPRMTPWTGTTERSA